MSMPLYSSTTSGYEKISNRIFSNTAVITTILEVKIVIYIENWVYSVGRHSTGFLTFPKEQQQVRTPRDTRIRCVTHPPTLYCIPVPAPVPVRCGTVRIRYVGGTSVRRTI